MRLRIELLIALFLISGKVGYAQEPKNSHNNFKQNIKSEVGIAKELHTDFMPGGRLILHITSKNEKGEPRLKSEIAIGVTPFDWNPSKPFIIDSKVKDVLSVGLDKVKSDDTSKYYAQVVYKQDITDGQEIGENNLFSNVDSFHFGGKVKLHLTLQQKVGKAKIVEHKYLRSVVIKSELLSAFSGYPRYLKASILLPSNYYKDSLKSYPVCYRALGLNGRYTAINGLVAKKDFMDWWFSKDAPQVIYVYLDSQGPYGDTYQVDSENNGPCGKALTEELMPVVEKMVHYQAASKKRYIAGGSTGGWIAVGLQVLYPDIFDGCWSYSPDPIEFEHYGLINIYSDENIFYNRWGYLQPGRRTIYGEPTYSMKEWIHNENLNSRTGDYRVSGGQFGAYNAVFGPKGADGLPSMMFDPFTGMINHDIAKQWEKYDLKKILQKNWSTLGPKLQGKIWIWTGDMDGLYSNVSTRFFKAYMDSTTNPKSDAVIRFTPMAGHTQEWSDTAVLRMVEQKAISKGKEIWLDDLEMKKFSEGIPSVLVKTNASGDPLQIAGVKYMHGVGVGSTSIIPMQLSGNAIELTGACGVDDQGVKNLPHYFYVLGDGKVLFESGPVVHGDQAKKFRVNLKGVNRLGLLVKVNDEGFTKVFSNWVDAKITISGNALPTSVPNDDPKYILTPAHQQQPQINTPGLYGVTPGNPFLFYVSASGLRPMKFDAIGLPNGLSIDKNTGVIQGVVLKKGNYSVSLKVSNASGKASKILLIKIGDTISLTPPMGWNGWNSWSREIDREKVIASAQAMVEKGLRDHGWSFVNIDDAWQGYRGGQFKAIQPNEKFPRFKEMIDTIHGMGMKLGVYSTPWITSYAGYVGGSSNFEQGDFPDSVRNNKRSFRYIGKYRFEENDAKQFAAWGVDFLKYDWRIEVASTERMSTALKHSGRDIIYSLSNSAPFSNVKDWVRLTNMYRTGPDIRDSWHGLYQTTFTLDKWGLYGGPGHWNDPDMMIVGNVTTGQPMHPTRLTPDEQYSHVSLYALLSAPMLIGCPIDQLDGFTLSLLTNDEVIAVDQDPLGKSARLISTEHGVQVWLKEMAQGKYAIGVFNTAHYGETPASYFRWGNEKPVQYHLDLNAIGLKGKWNIRDVWRQKNIAEKTSSIDLEVKHHGVVMMVLSK